MNNDLITIISLLIGLLGLVATLVGTYFTYISFVNPIKRFKKYLKNPENWEKFQGIENHLSFYRHKKYPNFQIVIDWADTDILCRCQELAFQISKQAKEIFITILYRFNWQIS